MMFGGGMMLGIGLLTLLFVLGVPLLLIVGGVALLRGLLDGGKVPLASRTQHAGSPPAGPAARFCSHCGYGLQADWAHCPNCGAPVAAD